MEGITELKTSLQILFFTLLSVTAATAIGERLELPPGVLPQSEMSQSAARVAPRRARLSKYTTKNNRDIAVEFVRSPRMRKIPNPKTISEISPIPVSEAELAEISRDLRDFDESILLLADKRTTRTYARSQKSTRKRTNRRVRKKPTPVKSKDSGTAGSSQPTRTPEKPVAKRRVSETRAKLRTQRGPVAVSRSSTPLQVKQSPVETSSRTGKTVSAAPVSRSPYASALRLNDLTQKSPYGDIKDKKGLRPYKPGQRYDRQEDSGGTLFGNLFGGR